jgi:hypothetical protein
MFVAKVEVAPGTVTSCGLVIGGRGGYLVVAGGLRIAEPAADVGGCGGPGVVRARSAGAAFFGGRN